jgi:cephalosporin hydroxylase
MLRDLGAMTDVLAEYRRRLGIWTDIQGHLEFMHGTVLSYDKPVVIELGIQAGNSTCALLSAAELAGGVLHSCDIQTREQLGAEKSGGLDRVTWWDHPDWHTVLGVSDVSDAAQAWMPAECDVLFVDAAHTKEHVLAEMNAYMPRVKAGGVALFHDTQWLAHADTDLGYPGGVVAAAITEYCHAHGLSWENRPGSYGMGVVRV